MDDGLPQNICKVCAGIIESTIRFRKRSQASEMRLKHCLKLKKKLVGTNFERISLEKCVEKREPVEIIAPTQDIKVEIELKMERDFLDCEINPENDNSGFCTNENGCFKTQSEKELTIEPIHNDCLSKVKSSKKSGILYKCEICKELTETRIGLRMHMTTHTVRYKFLCEFCGKTEFSQTHMIRHQQAKHGLERDRRFSCSYCDYRALDRKTLEVHERHTHTKERPFVCDECGEAFYSHCVLKQHGLKHITDKPFQCDECQKNFKSRSRLTGHIMLVHRKRKYEYGCPHCPKTYHKSWESRKHIERIHGIPKDRQGKIPRFNLQEKDI